MINRSLCFICVFVISHLSSQLTNEVSLQVTGFIGGSVVLPCPSTEPGHKRQDIEVHWRHNNSENVYDIIKGEESVEFQNKQYKNRVETFPDKYTEGNFSIKLLNLQHTDAGDFICFINHSDEQEIVMLEIQGKKGEKENNSKTQHQCKETEADCEENSLLALWIVLAVLAAISVGVLIFYFIKKPKLLRCKKKSDQVL